MLVRLAGEKDFAAICELAAAMRAESPRFSALDYSEEKVYNLVRYLVLKPGAGGILVAEHSGKIIGMLAFIVQEHFFGSDRFASDLAFYIAPEHRGGMAFVRLVRGFEEVAADMGVDEKLLGVSTGVHPERTVSAMTRLGYEVFSTGLRKV